jgi:hypothetical protein
MKDWHSRNDSGALVCEERISIQQMMTKSGGKKEERMSIKAFLCPTTCHYENKGRMQNGNQEKFWDIYQYILYCEISHWDIPQNETFCGMSLTVINRVSCSTGKPLGHQTSLEWQVVLSVCSR